MTEILILLLIMVNVAGISLKMCANHKLKMMDGLHGIDTFEQREEGKIIGKLE